MRHANALPITLALVIGAVAAVGSSQEDPFDGGARPQPTPRAEAAPDAPPPRPDVPRGSQPNTLPRSPSPPVPGAPNGGASPPIPLGMPPTPAPWQAPPMAMPAPQQPGRYTLLDHDLTILDGHGEPTNLGVVTLLLDTATGEVSHLVREGNVLAWRQVHRHHGPPHPQPGVPWGAPPPPVAPQPFPPYPITPPSTVPPGVPAASPPSPPVSAPPPPSVSLPSPTPNPLVDTGGFRDGVGEAERLRAERRVGEAAFLALAAPGSVILDCRSAEAFARLHVRGAVNLPFPDITAESLARLIPSPDTRVLLYCNNNFAGAPEAFPAKVATAALNHHSFATLVAYGYRNVFELAPLVDVGTTDIPLGGSDAPEPRSGAAAF